jgi:hypothetical protein
MSKARETYYKIYATSELPVAVFTYSHRNVFGIIQIGSVNINFNEPHESNISKLEEIEDLFMDFMFWNNSDEGEKFWRENPIKFTPRGIAN